MLLRLAVLSVFAIVVCGIPDLDVTRTCEPILIKTCHNIGYNVTGMPNFVGHDTQRDAGLHIETFTPLIQYECSSRLRFFLCSVYAPMCTDKVPQPIGPCRPLCLSVKALCEPVLVEFGFKWPDDLNCTQFPAENNEKHMCMEGPKHEEQKHVPWRERPRHDDRYAKAQRVRQHQHTISLTRAVSRSMCKHLRSPDRYLYINKSKRCAPACRAHILYSKENKDFVTVWIAVWASACVLSTLYTIIVFFSNTAGFRYPEKIIIILSWCYFVYSITFFIRLIGGRDQMSCIWDSTFPEPILVQGGLDNINCTIVFTLLYYCGMAGNVWWAVLCLCWFLTAGLQWNAEILERFGTYFHVVAWILPAIQTIAILVMQAVDADELTGMCFVGNQDPQSLVRFVLVPSATYLAIGLIFLVAGFVAILKNKKFDARIGSAEEKWEILMVRIGIFAALYTIPAICQLSTNVYDFMSRDQWLASDSESRPVVEVFTLKIFMSLVVGITSGVWLYTSKVSYFKRVSCNLASKCCPHNRGVYDSRNSVLLLNTLQNKMTNV